MSSVIPNQLGDSVTKTMFRRENERSSKVVIYELLKRFACHSIAKIEKIDCYIRLGKYAPRQAASYHAQSV